MLDWFRWLFQLPPGASSFADGVDALHAFVIGTSLVGAFGVALAVVASLLRYRERQPGHPTPRIVATSSREAWMIGGILGLFLLWWVLGYRQYLHIRRSPKGASTVYVTAKQWMWKFAHSDGKLENNVLTLPLGRKTQLIATSRDVIHSFYVPAFRVKQDVLPGRYVTLWFEPTKVGSYAIECAEYCGVSHSKMLGSVRVLSVADYASWLEDQTSTGSGPTLAALGREAAVKHGCLSCHTVDGQRHIGPSWSRLYGSARPLQSGQTVEADAEYLTRSIMDPQAQLVAGFPPVMPTYLGSLSQPETAAIIEYIRLLARGPEPGSETNPPLPTLAPAAEARP